MKHTISRLALLTLIVALTAVSARAFSTTHFADSSKLAQGKWVKIKVTETGMHQITAADARSWGFNDLSNLHVFGYGGAMISEKLTDDIFDDLPQVPIVRTGDKVLFYAQNNISWSYVTNIFLQKQNPYATAGYYFVTDDARFSDVAPTRSTTQPAGTPVTTFTDRMMHEQELYNPGETGKMFLGEDFVTNRTQSFDFDLKGYVDGSQIKVKTQFATVSFGSLDPALLKFKYNDTPIAFEEQYDTIKNVADRYHIHYYYAAPVKTFSLSGTRSLRYTVGVEHKASLTRARLDYITVNYERKLALDDASLLFRSGRYAEGTQMQISGYTSDTHVWDVTNLGNILDMNVVVNGEVGAFSPTGSDIREYVAFKESGTYPSPTFEQNVANQNIHGEPTPDMIILAPEGFLAQAQRVAALHEQLDSMRVLVLDHRKVFNEFSGGTPDASAYRLLCKMFYDRGTDAQGHKLGYLCLFGGGSFDNRAITNEVKNMGDNLLLTWQSDEGGNDNVSINSDDYFITLEDNSSEPLWEEQNSIALGRFPVRTVADAKNAVDKLIKYTTKSDFGAWKNNVILLADNDNNSAHMSQSEQLIQRTQQNGGDGFIMNRIYIDAFTSKSDGRGLYFPDARNKFYNALKEGALWWTYVGHGSPNVLTADGMLTATDLENNFFYSHIPVLFAATCEFGRFDAVKVSGAEKLFTNTRGGVVAAIVPPRSAWINTNIDMCRAVGEHMFTLDDSGKPIRLGDILKLAKNNMPKSDNTYRFHIFGDPAMRIAQPSYKAVVETINGVAVESGKTEDYPVFKARQTIIFEGKIVDPKGNKAEGFNGSVTSRLFDSEQSVVTHGYGDGVQYVFQERSNQLSVAVDTVVNGNFKIQITIPSEVISTYDNYDTSLLNLYACDRTNKIEANGSNSDFYIYGYDETIVSDTIGPVIEYLGLNSVDFKDGEAVNESPIVMARITDESGINVSSSIGRLMTITLDDEVVYSDVNSFFTPQNVEQGYAGILNYPLSGLANGHHTIKLKVFDVYNNSSEKTVSFNVISGMKPELYDVYTDANPASISANFYVKHNRPDATLTITLDIMDLLGRIVWTTTQTGRSDMFTSFPITWDLNDMTGNRVQRGIYLYRATVKTDSGHEATKSKKIAVTAQ